MYQFASFLCSNMIDLWKTEAKEKIMRAILREDLRKEGLIPASNRSLAARKVDWSKSYECWQPNFCEDSELNMVLWINSKIEWIRVASIDFDFMPEEGD